MIGETAQPSSAREATWTTPDSAPPTDGGSVYPLAAPRMKDLPEDMRPREVCARLGAENVTDDILLAILLRSGMKGLSVIEVARRLLAEYGGSLTDIARAPFDELAARPAIGPVKAQMLQAAFELGLRVSRETAPRQTAIREPMDVARLLQHRAQMLESEVFWTILLDTRNRVKAAPVEVSRGLLDSCQVHPREIFRPAIRAGCAAVVLAHNHPSGDLTPSAEDVRITRQLVEAGRIVDIRVLDHVIVGHRTQEEGPAYLSLREAGLIQFEQSERRT